ncbi:MAG: MBL fold metallo-hydrolase, partial [Proteobacteria bacterium]|nr:MBL fold metallo-hydrolase [Pseudomonadota bacterium]
MDSIEIVTVPYGSDNYCYLLVTPRAVALVDCGEAAPVLARLKSLGRTLDAIFICHTHYDHTAGLPGVLDAYPDAMVYSPTTEVATGETSRAGRRPVTRVTDGMEITVG